jgi:outer membrane autotransporter protein
VKAKHLGLYGSTEYDNFYFDGSAGYTSLDNSVTRLVQTPLFTTEAGANFDGDVLGASLTGGYDYLFDHLRLGPVVSLGYLRLDQDGFSEQIANDIGITVDGGEAESLISSLGARLGGLYEVGDWRLLPRGELSWLHQFKDDPVELNAAFNGYSGAPFNVVGAPSPGDQALFNVGLAAEYGTSLTLNVDYSIAASDEQKLQLLSLGLAWLF